jgi:hypothetical protein
MLTSATTIAGLAPMLFETSFQAQVLIPMAASLSFGLLFGTGLVLFLVPTFYLLLAKMFTETDLDDLPAGRIDDQSMIPTIPTPDSPIAPVAN